MNQTPTFTQFGSQHFVSAILIVLAMIFIPVIIRQANSKSVTQITAVILASILLVFKVGEPIYRIAIGEAWQTQLPLQLCDIGAIAIALFLLRENSLLFKLGYFWGLGGGIQSILTPDLQVGFPHINFFFYFVPHGLSMICVLYAIVVFKHRPTLKSVSQVFLITLLYAAIIYPVNILLDANYLFLMSKPHGTTLLTFLGPWPWYILSLMGVAFFVFFIYYSPYLVIDFIKRRKIEG